MKLNTLLAAAVCASTLLGSCVNKTAEERQLQNTHTTLVDNEGYHFFQIVGEVVATGLTHANHAESGTDAKAKEISTKVKALYTQLDTQLDSLARTMQVDYPIKGVPSVKATEEHGAVEPADAAHTSDTTVHTATPAHTEHVAEVAHDSDYISHAQHELATLKSQFKGLTRNTNASLQKFAKQHLKTIEDLYIESGGKEDGHAHH